MKKLSIWLAAAGLAACVVAPFAFFFGYLTEVAYRTVFLAGSAVWFGFATVAIGGRAGARGRRE